MRDLVLMDRLLPLVDESALAEPWKPWMEKLIAGCGGMRAPVWRVPQWMPTSADFDPNEMVRNYFEHVDDLTDPDEVKRQRAARRPQREGPSAAMAEGTALAGLPRASGIVALIKSRFCACIAAIYEYEDCFKGVDTETATFPLELQEHIRHALRYALFLISIGGRRHISEDELAFVQLLTWHVRSSLPTPA